MAFRMDELPKMGGCELDEDGWLQCGDKLAKIGPAAVGPKIDGQIGWKFRWRDQYLLHFPWEIDQLANDGHRLSNSW